ncbi:MAG: NADH-quinone oxidoreductase subunit L [Solirubrobacterales bacterium]|nr:NADH-quinone oxidoreductase subunit L [Thermoleophilales bacterium]MCO5326395.1 NADH-quinone oxidoreductase subunit L [Solirubrobacterales bacterium]
MSATTYAWLVLAFPLAGSILIGLTWRWLPGRTAGVIGTSAIALAFLCAIGALVQLQAEPAEARHLADTLYDYAGAAGIPFDLGIFVDPLSVYMILVVSGVSMLIHLYSLAYMVGDEGYRRFFAYLNFFVFSMLLLILAGNYVLLIVGWAFVGYASYALISFWYRRRTATTAGMKAFVINVIGDIGLVFAAILLIQELGVSDYGSVFEKAPEVFQSNEWTIVAICLLLLVGAFAKSAQVPLHTWLPDAMEGPTPVSALIHAATMVTAGVYLIARSYPLFQLAPTAADVSAFIGLATLLIAASIALVVTDLKRIIAYSTMSQIGYMVVGVSIGAYSAGLFHLMTHAFFKALLFMAAGSVIAAMASLQNIDRMGGFRKAMPFTCGALTIGALALAGFPGTSGFFSKDEILTFAAARGGMYWIFAIGGYFAAILTAFYAFRIVFRVVYGDAVPEAKELEEGHLHHGEPENPATGEKEDTDVGFPGPDHWIAERALPMRIAMAVLSFGALFLGFLQIPGVDHVVESFLEPTFENSIIAHTVDVTTRDSYIGMTVGALCSLLGIGAAFYLYLVAPGSTLRLRDRFRPVHDFLENKWYFDELIDLVIYRPVIAVGRFCNSVFEKVVVQGAVVGGATGAVRGLSGAVRGAQSGFVRFYALLVIAGMVGLGLYFLVVAS